MDQCENFISFILCTNQDDIITSVAILYSQRNIFVLLIVFCISNIGLIKGFLLVRRYFAVVPDLKKIVQI